MNNITGPPVTGGDFFGREKEIEYVWNRISDGNNFIFPSPRRIGKTSFALRLLDEAEQHGWQTISINLEKVSSEEDFIQSFINELTKLSWWEKTKEKGAAFLEAFGKIKPTFNIGGAKFALEWQSHKKNIYSQLAGLLNHNEKTLIFFDELTVLLTSIIGNGDEGKKNVTDFLHWLRDLRITANSKIKWIYCSSVGIENFTHRHGISNTLNDVHEYQLKSFNEDESTRMLNRLSDDSQDLKLGEEIPKAIIDKLEYCLPYFLQITFDKIHALHSIDDLPVNTEIVTIAYNTLIEESHFNTWIERISEQYDDNKDYAFALLRHVCRIKEGAKRENLINLLTVPGSAGEKAEETVSILLYMLKNDCYLMEEDRLYRFRSPLLRDFWFNRFLK
jgi:AAA+ ATPase superfamily predicted ATPase